MRPLGSSDGSGAESLPTLRMSCLLPAHRAQRVSEAATFPWWSVHTDSGVHSVLPWLTCPAAGRFPINTQSAPRVKSPSNAFKHTRRLQGHVCFHSSCQHNKTCSNPVSGSGNGVLLHRGRAATLEQSRVRLGEHLPRWVADQ